jgi:cytidylate kinase
VTTRWQPGDDGSDSSADPRDARPHPVGVIALDGPSGTGKSTVARKLARELGVRYLDTGAMYRAVTVGVLAAGVDPTDVDRVAELVRGMTVEIGTDPRRAQVRLNGRDVTAPIRSGVVTAAVSAVSAVPAVRERLVAQQRRIIGGGGIVVEGRDIGTVVWPRAWPKVYLTASVTERARRRASELGQPAHSDVLDDLRRRDDFDSGRPLSPLRRAGDAVEVDTTQLDVDQVVKRLIAMSTGEPADHNVSS